MKAHLWDTIHLCKGSKAVCALLEAKGNRKTLMRNASLSRKTRETDIQVEVTLDGSGKSEISTGVGFFDHMLDQIARHSLIDLKIQAKGDLHIDFHHTVEDVGIALGQAIRQALGDMKGITRYADVHLPMDETLTRVAMDISGRAVLVFRTEFHTPKIGEFDTQLVREFFQAFATTCIGRKRIFTTFLEYTVDYEKQTNIFSHQMDFSWSTNMGCMACTLNTRGIYSSPQYIQELWVSFVFWFTLQQRLH